MQNSDIHIIDPIYYNMFEYTEEEKAGIEKMYEECRKIHMENFKDTPFYYVRSNKNKDTNAS